MHEKIEFRDKDGRLSATIDMWGSPLEVTVDLERGNLRRKIKKDDGFFKNFLENLRYDHSHFPNIKDDKQKWFEYRIQFTIEEFSVVAKDYVKQDENQIERIMEERKTEEQKNDELNKFIKSTKEKYDYHPGKVALPIYCPKCGKGTDTSREFCQWCGENILTIGK